MTADRSPVLRVRTGHVAWVADRLSARDWAVIETVNQLHLVTGRQLERLYFAELSARSRTVTRSRTLARLVAWRVLVPLPRRVGGPGRGSTVSVYALDTAGRRLLIERLNQEVVQSKVRRPGVPSERFVRHILAISELYVNLIEAERAGRFQLRTFQAEPAAWWPNGLGGWLKPDAFVVVSNGTVDYLWWIEVDLGTESIPTVIRKLRTYVDFVNRGQFGPRGVVPRVLVSVLDERRRVALAEQARRLPPPATELLQVITNEQTVPCVEKCVSLTTTLRTKLK
jgi:Replication-relaxation